jgi:hypothetical protein
MIHSQRDFAVKQKIGILMEIDALRPKMSVSSFHV